MKEQARPARGFSPFFNRNTVIGLIFLFSAAGRAQKADSTVADSVKARTKSPRGAMLRSAVLPGWGQWYNGQKIKSFLVVGGELGLIGNAWYQNRMALRSKTPEEREFFRNNRNLSIWWCVGVYFLNLMDAYVDAQLWHFDTGPDLGGGVPLGNMVRFGVDLKL
jgi:hypothetical protein